MMSAESISTEHGCHPQASQLSKAQEAVSKQGSLLHSVLAGFKLGTEIQVMGFLKYNRVAVE